MTLIFESEESFLPDQSTSLTLTHELNLDPCSNFENIRTKNLDRLITAHSPAEILHSNVDTFNFRN